MTFPDTRSSRSNWYARVSTNSPPIETSHIRFQDRIMRQRGTRLPLHSAFLVRIASISGLGSVVRHLPPSFASGYVSLPSLLTNAGTTSKVMPSRNGTRITWPSALMLVVE